MGSVIDYKCEVPLLEPELIDVTVILHGRYQMKIAMGTLNVLCALMKIDALMIEESRRKEKNKKQIILS